MRITKKIIYAVIILSIALYVYKIGYSTFVQWLTLPVPETAKFEDANILIAYPLSKKKWLDFNISNSQKYIKVTTNAMFLNSPGVNIDYAVDYEILDDSSKVLYKNTYYLKTQKKIYRKWYSKRVLSNPYMISGHYFLSPTQTFIIPLFGLDKKLNEIRFKWHVTDNSIEGIILRITAPKKTTPGKSNILWLRLPADKRRELSMANFYPEKMITVREKENVMENLASSVGPVNKHIDMIRIGHAPYHQLHPKLLTSVKIDRKSKAYKSELYGLYKNSAGGHYKAKKAHNLEKVETLFVKMFKNCKIQDVKKEWNKLGMEVMEIKRSKRVFHVVYENPDKKTGRGFYIFCKSKLTRNIVLEMPHRFFDQGTGLIGYRLMLTGYFAAGAWNTVYRYQTPNYIPFASDMAHNVDNSYFAAFTKAFCKTMPDNSMLIQLHGYTTKDKTDEKVKNSKIVISESTNTPGKKFIYYADRLEKRMPNPLYIYPEVGDIDELAALNNAAAVILRRYESKGFVFIHFEMNKDIRKEMIKSHSLRKKFLNAIKSRRVHLFKKKSNKKQ